MITVLDRKRFLEELRPFIPNVWDGVEIGVYMGDFTQQIIEVLKPTLLTLIDPYKKGGECYGEDLGNCHTAYSNEENYQDLIRRFEQEILFGCIAIKKAFSYEVVHHFKDKSLDFLYLDGSHLYPDVKRDLEDWLPKMKDGGIISGHDYTQFDNFGVIPAVDEFIKEHKFEMFLLNKNGGDFALKRK